mgnify:CR=1 FL=1
MNVRTTYVIQPNFFTIQDEFYLGRLNRIELKHSLMSGMLFLAKLFDQFVVLLRDLPVAESEKYRPVCLVRDETQVIDDRPDFDFLVRKIGRASCRERV